MANTSKVRASPIHLFGSNNSSSKQPMKATLPVAAAMRSDIAAKYMRNCSSPSTPVHRRFSPDVFRLSGQRSPGSIASNRGSRWHRSLSRTIKNENGMRRTASLDTIHNRENFHDSLLFLGASKSTQTDDSMIRRIHSTSDAVVSDDCKIDKLLKQRLKKDSMDLRLISPPMPNSPISTPLHTNLLSPGNSPGSKPLFRGSLEDVINQEIERLVLKEPDSKFMSYGGSLEGRRPPLVELLRYSTRSVNTQTLGGRQSIDWEIDSEADRDSSELSGRSSDSPSSELVDVAHPGFRGEGSSASTPDELPRLGTSPRINRFLTKEPPDGCEKVNLRLQQGQGVLVTLKPAQTMCAFKPSDGSAFQPLHSIGSAAVHSEETVDDD